MALPLFLSRSKPATTPILPRIPSAIERDSGWSGRLMLIFPGTGCTKLFTASTSLPSHRFRARSRNSAFYVTCLGSERPRASPSRLTYVYKQEGDTSYGPEYPLRRHWCFHPDTHHHDRVQFVSAHLKRSAGNGTKKVLPDG